MTEEYHQQYTKDQCQSKAFSSHTNMYMTNISIAIFSQTTHRLNTTQQTETDTENTKVTQTFARIANTEINALIQKNMTKVATRHLWADYIDKCEDIRHTDKYIELYRLRKEKIERVFADAKEKHAMRYTPYRGLS